MKLIIGVSCRNCEVDGGPPLMQPAYELVTDDGYAQRDYECFNCKHRVLVHVTLTEEVPTV